VKAEKVKVVPELRFPGFEGEWENTNLGSLSMTVTSGSRDWAQYYASSGDRFVRMTNLDRNGIHLLLDEMKYVQIPENNSDGKRTSLEEDDILISITAELGKIGWIPRDFGKAYINQHTALIRLDKKSSESRFVAYKLSSKRMNKKINRLNDSGAKAGLNLPTIRSFPLTIPTLPEQRKIADFLTAVDGRIQQLIQKRALLEAYKKGVMQQLFTQAIRFKDDHGNDFPDWEEKKLGEIAALISGQHLNPDEYDTDPTGTPYFTGPSDFTSDPTQFKKWTKITCKFAPQDCVLVTVKGNGVGKLMYSELPKVAMGRQLMAVRSESCNNFLLFQFLQTQSQYFGALASGNMIPGLSRPDLLSTKIPVASLPEQTKIANFLSAIDHKIESATTQIAETQTFKRGLLQQMFV